MQETGLNMRVLEMCAVESKSATMCCRILKGACECNPGQDVKDRVIDMNTQKTDK